MPAIKEDYIVIVISEDVRFEYPGCLFEIDSGGHLLIGFRTEFQDGFFPEVAYAPGNWSEAFYSYKEKKNETQTS